jgi:RNA polymerase sigma factor (sigma-70 family)
MKSTTPVEESPEEFLPTRNSLLTRLKNWDDSEGWKRFFDTYWRLIYSAAIKSGLSDAEAQDVVQETVLSVAKNVAGFKYDPALGSFKGWLMTLTRWRIADQMRKRVRHGSCPRQSSDDLAQTDALEALPDEQGFDLDAIWDDEWKQNLMKAAVERVKRKVDARQYQLFDLYAIKAWPVADVVKTLGVTEFQVYKAKSRIAALIRQEIEILETRLI